MGKGKWLPELEMGMGLTVESGEQRVSFFVVGEKVRGTIFMMSLLYTLHKTPYS